MVSSTKAGATMSHANFPVKDINGVTKAMVFLEKSDKRWHVADYVYAPDSPNDHAQISIDDYPNEEEARKVFDFRKKAEQQRQEDMAKVRKRNKAS